MQAMAASQRTGDMLGVLYLDLDRFKGVNNSLGHQAGDGALVHIARALQACVRDSDTVCRLGGDEFVVLLPALHSEADLQAMADKIQQACALPFVWEGVSHAVYVSGGASLYPLHATQWEALLHCAGAAMYTAKQSGSRQTRLYRPAAQALLLARAPLPAHAV